MKVGKVEMGLSYGRGKGAPGHLHLESYEHECRNTWFQVAFRGLMLRLVS